MVGATSTDAGHESAVRRAGSRWPARGAVLALATAAFVCSLVVQHGVFPLYSGDKDEPVYVMQANELRHGHVTIPAGRDTKFFQPWLTGRRGDRIFFVFPVGWPAALAVSGAVLGSMRFGVALVAAFAVVAMYCFAFEILRRRRLALLAAALLAASPIFVVQSGLFLSYLFTLALGLGFGAALLRGSRTGSGRMLVAAGLLLGAVFMTRPFDAGLWSLPFLVWLGMTHRGEVRRLLGMLGRVALGFTPLFALTLAYNLHVTGAPLKFPISAAEPLNTFGFGPRRIAGTAPIVHYDLDRALRAAGVNLAALPDWMLGGVFALGLALVGVALRRRATNTWLLVGIAAVFPIGYLAYWGNTLMASGAKGIGPQYYIPLFPVLAIFVAVAVAAAWEYRHTVAVVAVVATAGVTAAVLPQKIGAQRDLTASYRRWQQPLIRATAGHDLVFVPHGDDPYLLTDLPFVSNDHANPRGPLFAADLGPANVQLVAERADRTPYVLTPELQRGDDLFHPTVVLKRLTLERGREVKLRLHVRNPGASPVVSAYIQIDGHFETRVLDLFSAPGKTYDVEWTLVPPAGAGDGRVAITQLAGVATAGVGFGPTAVLDVRADLYERRFLYRVVGFWEAAELQLLTPGLEYHRWTITKPAWVAENIEPVLSEVG